MQITLGLNKLNINFSKLLQGFRCSVQAQRGYMGTKISLVQLPGFFFFFSGKLFHSMHGQEPRMEQNGKCWLDLDIQPARIRITKAYPIDPFGLGEFPARVLRNFTRPDTCSEAFRHNPADGSFVPSWTHVRKRPPIVSFILCGFPSILLHYRARWLISPYITDVKRRKKKNTLKELRAVPNNCPIQFVRIFIKKFYGKIIIIQFSEKFYGELIDSGKYLVQKILESSAHL